LEQIIKQRGKGRYEPTLLEQVEAEEKRRKASD
jgi:hypothetical protein